MTTAEKTAGQVAFERYFRSVWDDEKRCDSSLPGWGETDNRLSWEAAAEAVRAADSARIAERDELIKELRDCLGDLFRKSETTCRQDVEIGGVLKRADEVLTHSRLPTS